jgi:hypothetical protein
MTDESDIKLALLEEQLRAHISQEEKDFSDLRREIKEIKESVDDLVSAWRAAGNVASFVKWLAGIAAALGVIWGFFHGNLWK